MNEPAGKTSALRLAAAWIVVTIPLAWGVYQTAIKALPLFRGTTATATGPLPLSPGGPGTAPSPRQGAIGRSRGA